jgi:hypothetical protein
MGRNIVILLLFVMSLFETASCGDSIPTWLDTIPPKISVDPDQKKHSSIFFVTLKSNERSVIWFSINAKNKMKQYAGPISISRDGSHTLYYYGEDDFANKSKIDSVKFFLDQRPPKLSITPPSGIYPGGTVVKIKSDEPCRINLLKNQSDSIGVALADSIPLKNNFSGYISAVDSCGNRVVSEFVHFQIDTIHTNPQLTPSEGVYNHPQKIAFQNGDEFEIFYSFDPVQPQQWFTKYSSPVDLPAGLTIVRYFGKSKFGTETDLFRRKYVIDTVPPKIIAHIGKGINSDTILLSTKEQSVIRYEINSMKLSLESKQYNAPILVMHKGMTRLRAQAWDNAGNESELFKWECKFDFDPPILQISTNGGSFTKHQQVFIKSNEPSKIFYTLDGSIPGVNSTFYNTTEGILISREDSTRLRYIGIDDADNMTVEKEVRFFIDTRPPQVKARITGKIQDGNFQVQLFSKEQATIYYETGGNDPGLTSSIYSAPVNMKTGQILKYFAVDKIGNRTPVTIMDELKRPRIEAVPDGGIFNKKIKIAFVTNTSGVVKWRLSPDTTFKSLTDTITLANEGLYSLEYYLEGDGNINSPIRRNEYTIDWTAPHVQINLKKGTNDSVIVFFESSENATIYYTTDGTNPVFSTTAQTAGNKYLQSKDRIVIPRAKDTRLAFFAEDVAKNQSAVSILDVMSPKAIPNVPFGMEKVYDRILSITLNTADQSTIYYCRHGHVPTTDSTVYTEPITLLESDTISAIVVDASGYKGPVDIFTYLIDLPPLPQFRVITDTAIAGRPIVFDASESIDKETPFDQLLFRWDFDGDGKFDTDTGKYYNVSHVFASAGNYSVVLEIIDGKNRSSIISRTIVVNAQCPADMISINNKNGKPFCIDIYEWPNIHNELPQTQVSWVEAKMSCIDAGKRLCSADEWETACRGINKAVYPYGNKYEMKRCPTEGKLLFKSGSFKNCNEFKVNDMTGNAWEWVEDKHGDYPLMYGGSFEYGKDAHCGLKAEGNIASRSGEIGFRCCK